MPQLDDANAGALRLQMLDVGALVPLALLDQLIDLVVRVRGARRLDLALRQSEVEIREVPARQVIGEVARRQRDLPGYVLHRAPNGDKPLRHRRAAARYARHPATSASRSALGLR